MTKSDSKTVWSSDKGDLRKQEINRPTVKPLLPGQQTVYLHPKKLKQICASGGTIKGDIIEIQGEHREKIAEALKKMGYKVKIAGG